jgi:hypothetical protein
MIQKDTVTVDQRAVWAFKAMGYRRRSQQALALPRDKLSEEVRNAVTDKKGQAFDSRHITVDFA